MRCWESAGPVLLGGAVRSAIPRAAGADGAAGSAAAAGRIARLALGAARTRAPDGDGPYAQTSLNLVLMYQKDRFAPWFAVFVKSSSIFNCLSDVVCWGQAFTIVTSRC